MARFSLSVLIGLAALSPLRADAPSGDEFFEKEVRPLLIDRCLKCHGGEKTRGGLKLTSRESILQGGETGPAAVPGKPNDSLLVKLLHRDDATRMPKGANPLTDHEIAVLSRWVEVGLPYPASAALAGGFHHRRAAAAFRCDAAAGVSDCGEIRPDRWHPSQQREAKNSAAPPTGGFSSGGNDQASADAGGDRRLPGCGYCQAMLGLPLPDLSASLLPTQLRRSYGLHAPLLRLGRPTGATFRTIVCPVLRRRRGQGRWFQPRRIIATTGTRQSDKF